MPPPRRTKILTPAGLSMPRLELWLDADKQAAMFHSWLLDEDWAWLARRPRPGRQRDRSSEDHFGEKKTPPVPTSKFIRCEPP